MHRFRCILFLCSLQLFALQALAQSNWDPEPYVTDSALVFHDDLDFYLNSYTKAELKAMRKKVNVLKMSFNKVMKRQIEDVRAFSEGRSNDGKRKNFSLKTTTGERVHVKGGNGKIRAFMFASITNPPALQQLPLWDSLAAQYDTAKVELFVVYGRELHPGDKGFKQYTFPKSETEKMVYAKELAAQTRLPVVVDGLDDRVVDLYGKVPNSAFVLDQNGTMVFRSTWADSDKIRVVLDKLLEWGKNPENIW